MLRQHSDMWTADTIQQIMNELKGTSLDEAGSSAGDGGDDQFPQTVPPPPASHAAVDDSGEYNDGEDDLERPAGLGDYLEYVI